MSKLRVAPRGTPPQQPDPPKAATLPDAARGQLGMLVTEVHGVAKVLRASYNIVGDDDVYSAVSMWVDRIAHDLGAMECRRYPAGPVGGA